MILGIINLLEIIVILKAIMKKLIKKDHNKTIKYMICDKLV